MKDLFFKTVIGALVLLITLGAGCGQSAGKSAVEENDSESQTEAKSSDSPRDVFNDTTEVTMDLTDSKLIKKEKQIKALLKDIFGKIKLNSYITGFVGPGSLITEYTTIRATTAADISLFAEALKNEGYKAEVVGVTNGVAMGLFVSEDYSIQSSYNAGGQSIGVQFMPVGSQSQFEQE